MRPLASLLLAATLGLAACSYARAIPMGMPVAPRPPDCRLAYEHATPAEAQAQWRQVGDVCLSGTGHGQPTVGEIYEPGDLRDILTEKACTLGGQVVTPIGLCTNGRSNAIEFGVYVSRDVPQLQPDPPTQDPYTR